MYQAQPRQYFASTHRAVADAIEWEEMPSLAKRVINRSHTVGANDSRFPMSTMDSSWGETAPAPFEPAPLSQPFVERLDGLATREVIDSDVFQHFFGPGANEA